MTLTLKLDSNKWTKASDHWFSLPFFFFDKMELAIRALTQGMMVFDRRPGAETRDQRGVTLIEELDTDILRQSLTRAFSVQ